MIVEIPFFYAVKYVPYRGRNERGADVRDVAAIEVREASEQDAPVALRVPAGHFSHSWNRGEPRDYRWFDGAFWRPDSVLAETTAAPGGGRTNRYAAMSTEELLRRTAELAGPFHGGNDRYAHGRAVTLDSLLPCKFPVEPTTLRSAAVRELEHAAADMLIVAGVVHRRVPEPIYHLRSFGGMGRTYFSVDNIHVDAVKPEAEPGEYFRADRLDDLSARYEDITGEKLEGARRDEVMDGVIEVLMPQTLAFRYDMRPRLMKQAVAIRESMKGDLAGNDLAFAAGFIALRDALAAREPDHDAIVAALAEAVVPAMRANGTSEWEIERAERLVAEWRDRDDPSLVKDADLAALAG